MKYAKLLSTIRGSWCFILCVLTASMASGQSSKISKDLANLPSNASLDVVIQYYSTPTSSDVNAATSAGASNGKHLGLGKSYKWTMSQGSVQNLIANDPNIKYVSPDRLVYGTMNYAVPAVGADMARTLGYDGTGVGVAVIDSGVNSVYDLQTPVTKNNRIVYSENFDPSANTTADLYGHGTHVAGIIAGDGALLLTIRHFRSTKI